MSSEKFGAYGPTGRITCHNRGSLGSIVSAHPQVAKHYHASLWALGNEQVEGKKRGCGGFDS
jgi:hypothetical protein